MIISEKTYTVALVATLSDGHKLELNKCVTQYPRKAVRMRREFEEHAFECETFTVSVEFTSSFEYSVNNVKHAHVVEWEEFEDPCAGCGGFGGGWVKDCYGCTFAQAKRDYIRRYAPMFK